jgi:ubiquitin-activating enzyme E1
VIEFNKNYIQNTLRWCKSELNPICAFLGGIVSQEALKITGKYMPIYQWLRFDFFEIVENIPNQINRNLLNCRYDDQIAIFGQEIQEKLMNLNIFMVGAGALGCEYIKNFALMGISCKNGEITVTDNDNIALSNLNRQFLFNINDVKENKSKSYCVRREAMKMNNNMKIKDYQLLINEETRNIFDDDFMEKQNVIISAVDNVDARKYIDNLCTFYNKILLDSGTEGTKANSDIYYPNKSTCLNDYPFIVKKQIPMCTLKDFPTKIEHCIEFSKNIFIELFTQYISDIKLTIDNLNQFENLLNQINDTNTLFLSIEIYKHIFNNINNPSKSLIIKFAIFIFKYYFDYNINKLLIEKNNFFEKNITNKKPSSLAIDPNEENTILYFQSFYNIFSTILYFNQTISIEEIISIISKENIIIKENTLSKEKLINEFNGEIIKKIEENENNIQEKIKSILPIKFEKDNDENFHINFILSFSNLRANNYNIEKTDFLKVKEVAGNIIPAIASTTAAISGLSCLQIYTILLTDNLNNFRNSNFNLATSIYDLSIPEEKRFITDTPKTETANETKVIPKKFTVWDKIDLYGPFLNVKNIVDTFKKKYDVEIEFINYKSNVLASPIDGDEDYEKTIEELVKEINGENLMKKKYIKLEISGSKGEADIITPTIRYILKK